VSQGSGGPVSAPGSGPVVGTAASPAFGFSVSPGPADGVAREAAEADALGYDRIGIWDSPALFHEPWVVLSAVASASQRIRLGTWVTNPLTRHPVVTASAAASLDELAPDRVYIGIGTGDTGVLHLGLPAASLAQLRRYVLTLRALLATGTAEWEGQTIRLAWARSRPQRRIPILVAAHGPRTLRLAGEIGDGVIVGLGITPEVIAGSLEQIEAGARNAGRRLDDLDIWFTGFWFVDPEPGRAAEQGAWAAASLASHIARTGAADKFVPPGLQDALVQLGAAYDKSTHGDVPDDQKHAYVARARRLGVLEYARQRFTFSGSPAEVVAQVRAAMAAGARCFDGAIDAPLPAHYERITAWARLVMPQLRSDG
jgi:5,10-methylenetetrahydromethanopterin reductase